MRLSSNIANFFRDNSLTKRRRMYEIDRWLLVIQIYIYFDTAQAHTNGCSQLKENIDEGRSLIVYLY